VRSIGNLLSVPAMVVDEKEVESISPLTYSHHTPGPSPPGWVFHTYDARAPALVRCVYYRDSILIAVPSSGIHIVCMCKYREYGVTRLSPSRRFRLNFLCASVGERNRTQIFQFIVITLICSFVTGQGCEANRSMQTVFLALNGRFCTCEDSSSCTNV
jgi:hypothetical protein